MADNKYKVLIPEDIHEDGKKYLLERGYEVEAGIPTDAESLKSSLANADALLARIVRYPKEILEAGKKLKVIARHGTGTDTIDVDYAESQGIWVVNAPTANGNTVAEFTVAMIMALGCDLFALDKNTRKGDWTYRARMQRRDLAGKVAGSVGLGKIGRLAAGKLMAGLDMEVMAYHPRSIADPPAGVKLTSDLFELLGAADYVSVLAPSTPETRGMFNYKAFSAMKNTAFFINCARGDIHVEEDLVRALNEGRIAGAGIDVYDREPRKESPLFSMEQVIVSQHSAGLSEESVRNMAVHAAMGIDEILRGEEATWPVNHPAFPRAGRIK
jgi:D-3-phosphoglycerate dehydrogenase